MMEQLRTWLLGVVFTAFAVGLANELVPKGRERALVRMVGGLLMMMARLRPLGAIRWETVSIPTMNFADQAELYRVEQENALSAIIAERLESYIWDKATELGIACTVHIEMSCGESEIPTAETVELRAQYDPALAAWLEEVVGIPAEKQIWLEERVWTEKTENG